MPETSQFQYCDKCGARLSGYAEDRLCAACLLESAILEPEAPTDARSPIRPLLAIDDHELLEEIARGGMGVVYRARQISLNRPVAIKMILGGHLANAAEMKRFRAEAETAAQLQHPNIVAIHEVGEHTGQPFFTMDLVEGRNLAQMVRDEPLPSRKAATYLKTIAEAVQYAHSRGVLHRDLKPSNILIDENDQPRITDFGLAKRLDLSLSVNDPHLTQTGQVLGSPSFIPPEQAAGRKEATGPASDVYSLGAILYQCLTARPPFMAETLTQTLRMVAENEPVSPRLLNASVPRDLETICLKCLEKDPTRRYATAQVMADDLDLFLHDEPIHARPIGPVLKLHRWCVRNKALAVTGTAVLALLLVVAIGSPIAAFRINRERARSEAALASEATLRKRIEARAKIPLALLRQREGKYHDAERLLDEIPFSFLEPDVTLLELRRLIGLRHAIEGNWKGAVTNFASLMQLYEIVPRTLYGTDDETQDSASLDYLLYGPSLVELGEVSAYESFRQSLVSRAVDVTNSIIAERICKVSLLLPAEPGFLATLSPLYELAVQRQADPLLSDDMKSWACISLALTDYRRGDFLKAAEWCEQCTKYPHFNQSRNATAQAILAMANYRLDRGSEARGQLTKAATDIEEAFRPQGSAYRDQRRFWYFDWIFARILLREAISLIGDPHQAK